MPYNNRISSELEEITDIDRKHNPIILYIYALFLQQQNFHQIRTYKDDFIQPSTLEEIKSSRVRKRTFSTSVISERTIQIKDDDLGKSSSTQVQLELFTYILTFVFLFLNF